MLLILLNFRTCTVLYLSFSIDVFSEFLHLEKIIAVILLLLEQFYAFSNILLNKYWLLSSA